MIAKPGSFRRMVPASETSQLLASTSVKALRPRPCSTAPGEGHGSSTKARVVYISGTKKEPKPKFLSPDIFWWGGGLLRLREKKGT